MGMAICCSIIDAHQCRPWISAGENTGAGATLSFTFPLIESAEIYSDNRRGTACLKSGPDK